MEDLKALNTHTLDLIIMAGVLVFARFAGFVAASPFFSQKTMKKRIRGGIMMSMAIVCAPTAFFAFLDDSSLRDIYPLLLLKELVIGFFMGVLLWMPVRGLELVGVILDTQRGATNLQMMDPIFSANTTVTAVFLAEIFSGYFFAVGGMILVLTAFIDSFSIWPAVELMPDIDTRNILLFIRITGALFFTAVIIALPVSGLMFVADLTIAFMAKAAPNLNALVMGMPVKTLVMLAVIAFYIEIAFPNIMIIYKNALDYILMVLPQ